MSTLTALLWATLVGAIFIAYASRALLDWYQYQQFQEPSVRPMLAQFRLLLRGQMQTALNGLRAAPIPTISKLDTIRVNIAEQDEAKLNAHLPESGQNQTVPVWLQSNTSPIEHARLRYRGDRAIHWLKRQKSLRIKLQPFHTLHGQRRFNLINPPTKNPATRCINNELSREAGLLAPICKLVRVFKNNRYSGVYQYVDQVDESFLRKNRRLPGAIYIGDTILGVTRVDLWENPDAWRMGAAQNREHRGDRRAIDLLIGALNDNDSRRFHKFFATYVDAEQMYAWMGMDTVFGAFHHDFVHNHKLYFDPGRGRFLPIQWDMHLWSAMATKTTSRNKLQQRIALDPVLEFERDRTAFRLLRRITPQYVLRMQNNYRDAMAADWAADNIRDAVIRRGDLFKFGMALAQPEHSVDDEIAASQRILEHRRNYLKSRYADAAAKFNVRPMPDGRWLLTVTAFGNSPLRLDFDDFRSTQGSASPSVWRDYSVTDGGAMRLVALHGHLDIVYPGRHFVAGSGLGPAWQDRYFGAQHLAPAPLVYRYVLSADARRPDRFIEAKNSITGDRIRISRGTLQPSAEVDSIHPWLLPEDPAPTVVHLAGSIDIDEDRVYQAWKTVMIAPGTVFNMGPGASIFFYGRVLAQGNTEQPIRFIPKHGASAPWGVIALQGPATSGSLLSHIQVSGGSVATRNLIDYTGQLNIHDSPGFRLQHCLMAENHLGDDNLHVVYSKGFVQDCTFRDSRSDALDMDISSIQLTDSLFVNSGNDAVDTMDSRLHARHVVVVGTGDKCFSLGEASRAELTGSALLKCQLGASIKDLTRAHMRDVIIWNAGAKSLELYNKNPLFAGGGRLVAENVTMLPEAHTSIDPSSTLLIQRTGNTWPKRTPASVLGTRFNYRTWPQLLQAFHAN